MSCITKLNLVIISEHKNNVCIIFFFKSIRAMFQLLKLLIKTNCPRFDCTHCADT